MMTRKRLEEIKADLSAGRYTPLIVSALLAHAEATVKEEDPPISITLESTAEKVFVALSSLTVQSFSESANASFEAAEAFHAELRKRAK